MAAGIAEGRRVLVVEDEFTIVLLIEELLDLGIQVIGPASRLDAALRLAREAQIDAAMLDINILGGNSHTAADILVERGFRSSSAPTTAIGPWRSATAIVRV
jgi:CheY-like chemotaxis protein